MSSLIKTTTKIYLASHFSKNRHHVYYLGKIIADADPITFQVISGAPNIDVGKDKNAVYAKEEYANGASIVQLTGADPATFRVLGGDNCDFAVDKSHAYSYSILPGALTLSGPYFYNPIASADPATFTVIRNTSNSTCYAKDKNHVYQKDGALIQNVNPNTFNPNTAY